ncbi:MAG: TolC family protein, partial [Rikenellaceae bacterium]
MKKIFISALLCFGFSVASGQQSPLLEKYRTMAVEYNHDIKAAQKNIAISVELEKMARADRKPKLTSGANFKYTGNPLE